jgi:hypothetical protein
MRTTRKRGRDESRDLVADFLRRAQAAGVAIEGQNDRDSAQGVLDYWAAWQFSSDNRESLMAPPPTLAEFVPSETAQLKPAENPYVGLRAFEERDTGFFIGREEATRKLLDMLRIQPIIFVSGPLGSGKSSLVFAGVVPRLRSSFVLETRRDLIVPVVIPGADPLTALLQAILQVATDKPENAETWLTDHRAKLSRAPDSLPAIVETVAPGATVVLVMDQFEEVFSLCENVAEREQFAHAIAAMVRRPSSNRAILIIREDYAQRVFAMEALKPFADEVDTRFSPPLLTTAELVRVISNSAEAVGIKFDNGIVEDLAQDVTGDPASLPTLQFTLSRLWAALPDTSNRITRDIYRQVGRPRVALANAAEAAFDSLSAEEKATAQRLFLELVQPGIGSEVRRRRIPRDDLVQLTGDSAVLVTAVLKRFEDAELIRKTLGLDGSGDRYEVAHEALVSSWKRLNDWLAEKRQECAKRLQLITTARLWQESGQDPGYLLTGDAIKDAMPYAPGAPELRDLIAASESYARRRSYQQRIGGALLGAFVIVIAGWLIWATDKRRSLSTAFDDSDRQIEQLQTAAIQAADTAARLKEAEETIARQQRLIDQLQKTTNTAPAPRPLTPAPKPRAGEISATGQQGWIWVGSDPDTNLKDAQTSAMVLPSAIKTSARYIITKNVVLRSDKPTESYVQSASLGLVLNGTPVSAMGPAIAYDRPSGTKQYWLQVRVDPSSEPIVFYQYASVARPDADQLAEAVRKQGYRIGEVQPFDVAKGTNEVRYFYSQDKPSAVKLASDVTKILRARGSSLPPTRVVDPIAPPLSRNFPGVLELWLDPEPR